MYFNDTLAEVSVNRTLCFLNCCLRRANSGTAFVEKTDNYQVSLTEWTSNYQVQRTSLEVTSLRLSDSGGSKLYSSLRNALYSCHNQKNSLYSSTQGVSFEIDRYTKNQSDQGTYHPVLFFVSALRMSVPIRNGETKLTKCLFCLSMGSRWATEQMFCIFSVYRQAIKRQVAFLLLMSFLFAVGQAECFSHAHTQQGNEKENRAIDVSIESADPTLQKVSVEYDLKRIRIVTDMKIPRQPVATQLTNS